MFSNGDFGADFWELCAKSIASNRQNIGVQVCQCVANIGGGSPHAPVKFTRAPEEPLGKMDKGYFWVTPLGGSLGEKNGEDETNFSSSSEKTKLNKVRVH